MVIRSTQYLHQIFKKRWRAEHKEEWKDEENYVQNFISQHCHYVLKKAIPLQKKILLESSTTEDWDISIMSLVLLNCGDKQKYKFQNQAVRELKKLRNYVAHHKSKKIAQTEYCEKLKILKESLQLLQIDESEINKLIEESSVCSSMTGVELVKLFIQDAAHLLKVQNFESALKKYSEALNIPGLLPNAIAEIYEKRAACYLNMKNLDDKYIDQAILDVEQAMRLKGASWNAHYIKAQCLRKKENLREAIQYFEMALAISPMQQQVRKDLHSCKLVHDQKIGNARLNFDTLPISLTEQVQQINIDTGWKFSIQDAIEANKMFPAFFGDQHYHGWEVPQDYKKAVRYYTAAYEQGDAEGCQKLGQCYFRGHGLKQDMKKGFELMKECAAMDKKQLGRFDPTPLGFNEFVATAENNLGKCYEAGLYVEKDIIQAAYWYSQSMKHGFGEAASSMGKILSDWNIGDIMPKSDKLAEQCWKQGMNFKSSRSAELLVDYYCSQFEPEMAWTMLHIAREMGSSKYIRMSDEEFNLNIPVTIAERNRVEKIVTTFEKRHNLDFKGMTLKQRCLRVEEHVAPTSAQIRTNENVGGQLQRSSIYDMSDIRLKAESGSETACQIVETVDWILKLNELLEMENDVSKIYKLEAVNMYYEIMLQQSHLVSLMTNVEKFRQIVAELFNESCEQISEDEMNIRFCYLSENLRQFLSSPDEVYAFGILKEGIRRYPDNYVYYRILIDCLKERSSNENALQHVNEAIEKFPDKVDLLYEKAHILLHSADCKPSEVLSAFKAFLGKAPRDHRFVPQAYYNISFFHVGDYLWHEANNDTNYNKNKKLKLIRKNIRMAKDAENDQLPCYLPYGVSDNQLIVTKFLAQLDGKDDVQNYLIKYAEKETVHKKQHIFERKAYIQSPVRKGLVLQHRERFQEVFEMVKKRAPINEELFPVKLHQSRAKKMCKLRAITLQEMNPAKEKVYVDKILDLTIIEDPNPYYTAIEIIAEDENGDTTRVYIDRLEKKTILHRFQAGCRFAVINPYMWIEGGINGIRINEPKCIVYLGKIKDMCRFCGEENATLKCPKCGRPYCSNDCEKLDCIEFEHKLVCFSVPDMSRTLKPKM